jgi:hypothetical protein
MKELLQLLLIAGGALGVVVSLLIAAYGWLMQRGFGGDLSFKEGAVLYSPLICVIAVVAGLLWRNQTKKGEPRRPRWKLSEGD